MKTILIIGGGIGGLTAALALRRRGFESHVYEAAPELQPVGKGIWVPTNAMQVLHRLGLSDDVRRSGWPLDRIQLLTRAGLLLLDCDLHKFEAKYGHTTVSIHRAALVQVLADALPPDALHLGKRATEFAEEGSRVAVRFDDGTQAEGELLVAADGIRSAVREHFFPGGQLNYSGQTCYRGVADLDLPAALAHKCQEVWGGDARMGFSALGPRQVYWFAPVTAPAGSPLPAGAALGEHLDALYAEFPDPIPDILRHTPAEDIIRTDLFELVPLRRWWRGRVVLLGDAAHAMTPNLGQGGAQAIEDAYALAARLADSATVERGLAEYERLRMPKARWIARTARRLGQTAHWRRPWLQRFRDFVMRLTPGWWNDRQIDRVYALNF